MAAEIKECEVWVMVDSDGDYACCICSDGAEEKYDSEIGGSKPRRMVKVVLSVPLPSVPTLIGAVPAEGEAGLSLAVA
jgi:hypothetical protein